MAHVIGEIHSNGKWIWTEYQTGKFDWRTIKNSTPQAQPKKVEEKKETKKVVTLNLTKPQQELYNELQKGRKVRVWYKSNTYEYHFDHGTEYFTYDLVRYRTFWNLMMALAKQKAQENNETDWHKYQSEIAKQYLLDSNAE